MDIHNHSVPHYFKYLLLRYHSLVHFIQSKSYSIRLFEKKHLPSPTTSYCVTYQICLICCTNKRLLSLYSNFQKLTKTLGGRHEHIFRKSCIVLGSFSVIGHSLVIFFSGVTLSNIMSNHVAVTTNVTKNTV